MEATQQTDQMLSKEASTKKFVHEGKEYPDTPYFRNMVARNKVTKYSNGGYLRYNLDDHDLILLVDVSLAKKYKKGILDKNGKLRKPFVQVKYKNLKKLTYQGIVNTVLECAYDIKENESNSNFGGCFSCEISHHKKGHS